MKNIVGSHLLGGIMEITKKNICLKVFKAQNLAHP
jgi:hypothetical protein